jgi:hypothetical protein
MDYSIFAHLRPKQRTDEYAADVAKFIAKCPEDSDTANAYWNVVRSCRCIDCHATRRHVLPYRSGKDWYRVRNKTRRAEVRNIVFMLLFVDIRGSEQLSLERDALMLAGQELIALYDEIIDACS